LWDICMLKSKSEAWNFSLMILIIFLHNIFRLVVGRQLLPTTLKIFTHMDYIHIALIISIVRVIVHPVDNYLIFHMSKRTPISSTRDLIHFSK
jgi:hypothetical protein